MTSVIINDILPLTQLVATGSQTVYSTDWTANAASDVVVYSRPANTAANDVTQILNSSQYNIAFIGDQQIVQVTLLTPSTVGDIVTITRMTPADRENLYTNTNFVPNMLNNDFGILTLVDQQAQLVNSQIGPRYNYSAIIDPVVDTILPILIANQTWAKDPNDAGFIGFPLGTAASAYATNAALQYVASASGPFTVGHVLIAGDALGTIVDSGHFSGFGTVESISTGVGLIGGPITVSGEISFAPIAANTFWANVTGSEAVPTQVSLDTFIASSLPSAEIFVGNNLNQAAPVTMSGDAVLDNTGAITVSKIGGNSIALSGAFSTVGAFTAAFTFTGNTGVTFPTSGTLATAAGSISVVHGDTGEATVSNGAIAISGASTGLTTFGSGSGLGLTGTLNITNGGTGVTSVTILPTATSFAGWDANKNLSANSFLQGYTSTVTAAGTTTLTVASTQSQFFMGTTTQTVVLPVVSTLALGQRYYVVNNSTGNVTIQSSGGNSIQVMASGTTCNLTCILTSGTSAASWYAEYAFQSGSSTGTVNAGTLNQLAWYAANGTAVSGLSTGNNGVLITSAGGVPSISSTLPNSLVIPGPKISQIYDPTNSLLVLQLSSTAGAVNNFQFNSSTTTNPVTLSAIGSDTNISLTINGKGTGGVAIQGNSSGAAFASGYVAELVSNTVPYGSPVTGFVNGTPKNITSISLTAGNWDIYATAGIVSGGVLSGMNASISTTSATQSDFSLQTINYYTSGLGIISNVVPSIPVNISSTTTYYLVMTGSFTVSASGFGNIYARRR